MRIILNSGGRRMRVRAGIVLLSAVLALSGCATGSGGRDASGRVQVVAAENFWGSLARQIAGPDADVSSIITSPDTDPHDYEPTADDARSIATASLVIENGIGYDAWVQKLIAAAASEPTVLDVGKLVHVPERGNPHQWYARATVSAVIERLTQDLVRIDPRHRAGYEQRERALVTTGLAQYDALIARIKGAYAGTAIGGSESIVTLLASTLGLRLITPESFVDAVAEGNEPTATDKATVDAQITHRDIKVFIFNRQNATPDVQRLVDEAHHEHIPVATVTETLEPASATFQQWQTQQFRGVLSALEQAQPS